MAARRLPDELLRLEVRELTGLLRLADSFAGLRGALASKGIAASEVILAGLIESEAERRYGVIVTPGQDRVLFETARDDSLILWEIIDDPRTLGMPSRRSSSGSPWSGAGRFPRPRAGLGGWWCWPTCAMARRSASWRPASGSALRPPGGT